MGMKGKSVSKSVTLRMCNGTLIIVTLIVFQYGPAGHVHVRVYEYGS